MKKKIIIILTLLCFGILTYGEEQKSNLLKLPIAFSTPETGFALGGMFIYYKLDDKINDEIPVINASAGIMYTTKKQGLFFSSLDKLVFDNKYKVNVGISLKKWKDSFYGIGKNTYLDNEIKLTEEAYSLRIGIKKKISKNIEFGPKLLIKNSFITKDENTEELKDNLTLGLGLEFLFDNRDNTFYSKDGDLLELTYKFYRKELGGDSNFSKFEIDYRNFTEIINNHIIASQIRFVASEGEVPYQYLTSLGSQYRLRGISEGRFIDKNFLAFQSEYRFPVYKRLSGVLFGAVGQVANKLDGFYFKDIEYTGGFGARITLDKSQNINIRLDFAFNNLSDEEDKTAFYFSFGEAF